MDTKIKLMFIGIILIIIGGVHIKLSLNIEKSNYDLDLEHSFIVYADTENYHDIVFYKIVSQNNKNLFLINIIDPFDNIIEYKKIRTEMSINYFNLDQLGAYTIKIIDLKENNIGYVEIGVINTTEIYHSTIILLIGIIIIIFFIYLVLRDYKIAQPDASI